MKIFIYGKEKRFYGNQHVGKTWRMTKTILSGTWIGVKEMVFHPGKTLLGVLMLGLAFATFIETSEPYRLWIASAYADLTTEEEVRYVREEVPEEPAKILAKIAACENGGHQMKNGRVIINVNKNGSIDVGTHQINNVIWEKKARELGYDIYTEGGNLAMAEGGRLGSGTVGVKSFVDRYVAVLTVLKRVGTGFGPSPVDMAIRGSDVEKASLHRGDGWDQIFC